MLTSNFVAEAEGSSMFLRFEAENSLNIFLNVNGIQYLNMMKNGADSRQDS